MIKQLTRQYLKTLNRKPFFLGKLLRGIIVYFTNYIYQQNLSKNNTIVHNGIFVSLTSFPVRIKNIDKVILTLLNQTILPEKIFLILSEKQFPNKLNDLPNKLLKLRSDVFEVIFEKDDIRSHKKYFYVMDNYSDKIIITVDDDIFYPEDLVENLINYHKRLPNHVICNRGNEILFDTDKNILAYKEWKFILKEVEGYRILLTGCSAVLYPPNFKTELLVEKEVFMRLAPQADDLWLYANAVINNRKILCTALYPTLIPVINKRDVKLNTSNVNENLNDTQLLNINNFMNNMLFKKLLNER